MALNLLKAFESLPLFPVFLGGRCPVIQAQVNQYLFRNTLGGKFS